MSRDNPYQLRISITNRHSRLALDSPYIECFKGVYDKLPKTTLSYNETSLITCYDTYDIGDLIGCLVYQLTGLNQTPLPARLFLLIVWHHSVVTGIQYRSHIIEADYELFPEDRSELRRKCAAVLAQFQQQQSIQCQHIQIPDGFCFGMTAALSDDDMLEVHIEPIDETMSHQAYEPIAPIKLLPSETILNDVETPLDMLMPSINSPGTNPCEIIISRVDLEDQLEDIQGDQLVEINQETCKYLEILFSNQHTNLCLDRPLINLQQGKIDGEWYRHPVMPKTRERLSISANEGQTYGTILYQIKSLSVIVDVTSTKSKPISEPSNDILYLLLTWSLDAERGYRYYVDIIQFDGDIQNDSDNRQYVYDFAMQELNRCIDDIQLLYGRRRYVGQTKGGYTFGMCAIVQSKSPECIILEITPSDISQGSMLPVWLSCAFNSSEALQREKSMILTKYPSHPTTSAMTMIIGNHHPLTVLRPCTHYGTLKLLDQTWYKKQLEVDQHIATSLLMPTGWYDLGGYIIYELVAPNTTSTMPIPSIPKKKKKFKSLMRYFKKKKGKSLMRCFRFGRSRSKVAKKSVTAAKTDSVTQSTTSAWEASNIKTYIVASWVNIPQHRMRYGVELLYTDDPGFINHAPHMYYILLLLATLTRTEQGHHVVRRENDTRFGTFWTTDHRGLRVSQDAPGAAGLELELEASLELGAIPTLSVVLKDPERMRSKAQPHHIHTKTHASAFPIDKINVELRNQHPIYQLVNGHQYVISSTQSPIEPRVMRGTESPIGPWAMRGTICKANYTLLPASQRTLGIICYQLLGNNHQEPDDTPVLVIAWHLSVEYVADFCVVANVLQHKRTGYDGRGDLLALPNLYQRLFDTSQSATKPANYTHTWTGLVGHNQRYAVRLCLSVTNKRELDIQVEFTDFILSLGMIRVQNMLSQQSSSQDQTALLFTLQNCHQQIKLDTPILGIIEGSHDRIPLTKVLPDETLTVRFFSKVIDSERTSGFMLFKILRTDGRASLNDMYFVVGWKARRLEGKQLSGEFFANMISSQNISPSKFLDPASFQRYYNKFRSKGAYPMGKGVKQRVRLPETEDLIIQASLLIKKPFYLNICLTTIDQNIVYDRSTSQRTLLPGKRHLSIHTLGSETAPSCDFDMDSRTERTMSLTSSIDQSILALPSTNSSGSTSVSFNLARQRSHSDALLSDLSTSGLLKPKSVAPFC